MGTKSFPQNLGVWSRTKADVFGSRAEVSCHEHRPESTKKGADLCCIRAPIPSKFIVWLTCAHVFKGENESFWATRWQGMGSWGEIYDLWQFSTPRPWRITGQFPGGRKCFLATWKLFDDVYCWYQFNINYCGLNGIFISQFYNKLKRI